MTGLAMGVRAVVLDVASRPAALSFEQFYAETWGALFDFSATLVAGDQVVAEEITQEAMARVFVRFDHLEDPRPYAFRVASNLVKRRWHLLQREPVLDTAALPHTSSPSRHDHTLDAVRRLPPRLRDVVLLHYYADLPVATVAHLLRRPAGTIKARLHEARAQLALALGDDSS